ncbi:hypothetical protein G9A89_002257 [Geosiphon pyriformis]|nr:hypothetical protein G9A89_002257 [Geosiphon pyriformis]
MAHIPPRIFYFAFFIIFLVYLAINFFIGSQVVSPPDDNLNLQGNFLHITDLHPDPFYKVNATIKSGCHKTLKKHRVEVQRKPSHMKIGISGHWGAPASICDSSMKLIDATFEWLEENWVDKLDFVIWTGDNSRHDNDDKRPRHWKEIVEVNQIIADKFISLFSAKNRHHGKRNSPHFVPIVPSFGNNDIYPTNILEAGPNNVFEKYKQIWAPFIPESQLEVFKKGGYMEVEVIKNRLIVASLNSIYFFKSNTAAQGCAANDEPGTDQIKWLKDVLRKARKNGMKVWIVGHVAPSKSKYTPTCWKKYASLSHQYNDVILGHLYGHSNMDYFYFIRETKRGLQSLNKTKIDEENYQDELELDDDKDETEYEGFNGDIKLWEQNEFGDSEDDNDEIKTTVFNIEKYARKLLKHYRQIPSVERMTINQYTVIHVNPSVIPTFFPGLRIYEYNTTIPDHKISAKNIVEIDGDKDKDNSNMNISKKNYDKPLPPINTFLSPIGYTQFFINLTLANLYHHKIPKYEVEYTTRDHYKMDDLTVFSWLQLANRLAKDGQNGKFWKKFREHLVIGTHNLVEDRIGGKEVHVHEKDDGIESE